MIADVGLIGLPNAGKSTFLASLSNARPEIANYPFTTLVPNLGVIDIDEDTSLLFADIPGLIAGASQGKGLGDEFLRHVERTAVLLHLIDVYNEDLTGAYQTIQTELQAYTVDLTKRPQIVVLTKIDGLDEEMIKDRLEELRRVVPRATTLLAISAPSKQGVPELLYAVKRLVKKTKTTSTATPALPVIRLGEDPSWRVTPTKTGVTVTGHKIERLAARTDFSSEHGLQRLRDIMKKMGITRELERRGVKAGERVRIGSLGSFEY
jgi:GTP-binding protein